MRTWLVRGTRRFAVDPRRRFGKHEGARRMLATDGEVEEGRHGAWRGLVSALQRHTVHGELAQLSKDDAQILSLAYLGGHTNREIAAMLQVSVSTVSRRLSGALARLEESMRRAGVWITSLALLALAGFERISHLVRTNRWPSTVALVAAGTATTVALTTFVMAPTVTSGRERSSAPVVAQPSRVAPTAGHQASVAVSNQPVLEVAAQAFLGKDGSTAGPKHASAEVVVMSARICHGNPTSAPPPVPVGPRGEGPHQPPVTHPGPGGCGHQNK